MWSPFGCSCVLILRCILDILPLHLSCAASTHGKLYLSMLGVCACYESRDAMLYSAHGFLPLYGPCRGHNLYNLRLWRGRVGYFAAVYSMPQERPYWTCSQVVYASVEVSEHVIVSNEFVSFWCVHPFVLVSVHSYYHGILSPVFSHAASIYTLSSVYPYLQSVCITSPLTQYCFVTVNHCLFVGQVMVVYSMPLERRS